ncbi:hypothetical protein BDC45DRAFT_566055 [Circinella umbellata]|nr:hypothetical protein BDC45DRAFT_566055 [Circinella umbellata]
MEADSGLYVHQDSGQAKFARNKGRRFEHSHIPTNGKECCPYTNRQCSEKADKNNICSFTVS